MTLTPDRFAPPRKGGCSLGLLLAELDPEQAGVLAAALEDPKVTGRRIAIVLTEDGHEMEDSTVNRHRRGGCKCP